MRWLLTVIGWSVMAVAMVIGVLILTGARLPDRRR